MLVYRVEFGTSFLCHGDWQTGLGPYRSECYDDKAISYLDNFDKHPNVDVYEEHRHPSPKKDARLIRNLENSSIRDFDKFHFGFTSLQKLSKWFGSYHRNLMHDSGYIVMVYETEELYAGTKQCVFNKKNSTLLRFMFLKDIY